jgi:hypothetical protein
MRTTLCRGITHPSRKAERESQRTLECQEWLTQLRFLSCPQFGMPGTTLPAVEGEATLSAAMGYGLVARELGMAERPKEVRTRERQRSVE